MKLKTLKDIKPSEDDWEAEDNIPKSKIKEEAIKWVKYRISNCVFSCRNNHQRCKEHKFWMERFNITEKELEDA